MIIQKEFHLKRKERGFHLITDEINAYLPELPEKGLLNLFLKHSSAALAINENADPDVRYDLENIYNRLIREREPYYEHKLEGDDDMPAHAKTVITGVSINIPVSMYRLNLGVWQGIYLCEFRDHALEREIVATIVS